MKYLFAVVLVVIASVLAPGNGWAQSNEVILKRLDALEKGNEALAKENATLRDRVRRLEAKGTTVVHAAPAAPSPSPATYAMVTKGPVASAPVSAFDWTGCHLGGQAGVGFLQGGGLNGSGSGWRGVAGGQVGCDLQKGQFVFGVDGDGLWSSMKAKSGPDSTVINPGLGGGTTVFNVSAPTRWIADVALRMGVANDRTLIYGKAGWAWNDEAVAQSTFNTMPGGPGSSTTNSWAVYNGLLLGGGFEYAFAPNWSVNVEYNFIADTPKVVAISCASNQPIGCPVSQSGSGGRG